MNFVILLSNIKLGNSVDIDIGLGLNILFGKEGVYEANIVPHNVH